MTISTGTETNSIKVERRRLGLDWPFALTFASFAIGLAVALVVSLTEQNLNIYRARFTIWLSMILVTPAFCLNILGRKPGNRWRAWRWFWTFAGLAYGVHFYYAVRAFHFSVSDIYEKQGAVEATCNFVVSTLWTFDLFWIWLVGRTTSLVGNILQNVTVALTFVTFFVESVLFKTGFVWNLGLMMTVIVAACIIYRLFESTTTVVQDVCSNLQQTS